ncbi:hypothetical protein [Algoriphagus taiwanensis]|uniref:Uncharacterized protein n=1 Tax=Algoriphagus taiwanensis TaxID=1445656 RepID=A0ABQ6Q2R7_9BACT|nr:hypothetical protein Ataiwa_21220 [Algoriphagus taiwanensis]
MKDFLEFLKSKTTLFLMGFYILFYFVFVQAYVYPTLTFDFTVAKEGKTWAELIFMTSFLLITQYFWLWKPNRKFLEKKKAEDWD